MLLIALGFALAWPTFALSQSPTANSYRSGDILIETPWSRASPGGAKVASGYMRIINTGGLPDRLVGGSADVAGAAANEQVNFLQQALATAETASELAKQLGETGALNKLEQAREHAFYVELGAQLARARIQQRIERERLTRQLGVWGRDIDFRLPGSLPPLPVRLAGANEIERQALRRRVDLEALRYDLSAVAGQYGLNQATRFVSDVELAGISKYERTKSFTVDDGNVAIEREKVKKRGLEVEFEIPIYDFGQANLRNAQETYMAAANRLAERAVNARSEARETYLRYRGNFELAAYYQSRVLPLRKTIQDETLLQYSGMLVDVTRLIVDARARILSNIDAINARRDFWIAATDLKAALVGGGIVAGGEEGGGPAAASGEAGGALSELMNALGLDLPTMASPISSRTTKRNL